MAKGEGRLRGAIRGDLLEQVRESEQRPKTIQEGFLSNPDVVLQYQNWTLARNAECCKCP